MRAYFNPSIIKIWMGADGSKVNSVQGLNRLWKNNWIQVNRSKSVPRGLKPSFILWRLSARLKSCPVTKHVPVWTSKHVPCRTLKHFTNSCDLFAQPSTNLKCYPCPDQ